VVILAAMRCSVTGHAQLMKEVEYVAWVASINTQTPQQVSLGSFASVNRPKRAASNSANTSPN